MLLFLSHPQLLQLGVPALAIKQPDEGLDVLRARATELRASSFNVVEEIPQLLHVKLGSPILICFPSLH